MTRPSRHDACRADVTAAADVAMLPSISRCGPRVLQCLGSGPGSLSGSFQALQRACCLQGPSWQQPPPPDAAMLVGQGWQQFPAPHVLQAGFPGGGLPPYGQPPPPFGQPFVQGPDWLPPQSHGIPPGAPCTASPSAANALLKVFSPQHFRLSGDYASQPQPALLWAPLGELPCPDQP